jgi:hypothetical protein
MNRFLTILFGLGAVAVGGLLGVLALLSLMAGFEEQLPPFVSILTFAMSSAMLYLGLITLMCYAYESRFEKSGIEMQFVFRKERVSWESIQWHRKLFFKNKLSGANVWVLLKYAASDGNVTHTRKVVLAVPGTGPALGTALKEFQTPFDCGEMS